MNSKRVVLNIPIWRTTPPEHADKGPCLCTSCWRTYLNWADNTGKLDRRRPAA
jgi:hypothetical protein